MVATRLLKFPLAVPRDWLAYLQVFHADQVQAAVASLWSVNCALQISASLGEVARYTLWFNGITLPGFYESESRNSHFQNMPSKATVCIPSADFDTFVADTMAQYRSVGQFKKGCSLSETTPSPNGFAIFSKNQVAIHDRDRCPRPQGVIVIDPQHDAPRR
jgi:hypothetical protein